MQDATPVAAVSTEITAAVNPALVRYDAACAALEAAVAVDEVKEIHDFAIRMALYGRQANNYEIEANGVELRKRARRKLGEMMKAQEATVGFNKGGGPGRGKTGVRRTPVFGEAPTLAEAGIDKNLAKAARMAAAMTEAEFEQDVEEDRTRILSRPLMKTPEKKKPVAANGKRKMRDTLNQRLLAVYGDGKWHALSDVARRLDEPLAEITRVLRAAINNGAPRAVARWDQRKDDYRLLFPTEKMVSVNVLAAELTPIIKELREQGKRNMETVSIATIGHAAAKLQRILDTWAE